MKGQFPLSGLWLVFGSLLGLFALLCTLRYFFPPAIEPSTAWIVRQADATTVEFDLTSHLSAPTRAIVWVNLDHRYTSGILGTGVEVLDHREVSVELAPAQTQRVRCQFASNYSIFPDCAEAIIVR